jgi:hypothetical protein
MHARSGRLRYPASSASAECRLHPGLHAVAPRACGPDVQSCPETMCTDQRDSRSARKKNKGETKVMRVTLHD